MTDKGDEHLPKKGEVHDLGEFRVTKYGVFRNKEPANDVAKPYIFKCERRPDWAIQSEPTISVTTEKGEWKGELPYDPAWNELFGDKNKVYLIGTPSVDGRIIVDCAISDQGW